MVVEGVCKADLSERERSERFSSLGLTHYYYTTLLLREGVGVDKRDSQLLRESRWVV